MKISVPASSKVLDEPSVGEWLHLQYVRKGLHFQQCRNEPLLLLRRNSAEAELLYLHLSAYSSNQKQLPNKLISHTNIEQKI